MTTANCNPPFHPVVATFKYQLLLEPMGTYMMYYGTVTGLRQNLITNTQLWAILYRIHRGLKHFQEPGLRNMTKNIQLTQQVRNVNGKWTAIVRIAMRNNLTSIGDILRENLSQDTASDGVFSATPFQFQFSTDTNPPPTDPLGTNTTIHRLLGIGYNPAHYALLMAAIRMSKDSTEDLYNVILHIGYEIDVRSSSSLASFHIRNDFDSTLLTAMGFSTSQARQNLVAYVCFILGMPLTHMVFLQLCDQPTVRRGPPMLTYRAHDPSSVPHALRHYAPRALEPSPSSHRSGHMSPSSDTTSDSGYPSLTSAQHLLTSAAPSQQLSPLGSRTSSSESQRKATSHRSSSDHPDSHGGTLVSDPLPPSALFYPPDHTPRHSSYATVAAGKSTGELSLERTLSQPASQALSPRYQYRFRGGRGDPSRDPSRPNASPDSLVRHDPDLMTFPDPTPRLEALERQQEAMTLSQATMQANMVTMHTAMMSTIGDLTAAIHLMAQAQSQTTQGSPLTSSPVHTVTPHSCSPTPGGAPNHV
jgi:hypothetical protein